MTASNTDLVRLLISDNTESTRHFSDGQIQAFLTMEGDIVLLAAARALESWAANLTEGIESEKIGDYGFTKKAASNKLTLATQYRESYRQSLADAAVAANITPALGWATMDLVNNTDNQYAV